MKDELRSKYKIIRRNIKDKSLKDRAIFDKVISNDKVVSSKVVLIYVSLSDEVDTFGLIDHLLKSKRVAVPKIVNGEMRFYFISSFDDLEKGYFGVLEPTTCDEVLNFSECTSITPGICFSKSGYRVGYGKGFYDRFYNEHNVYKIGICYKECLVDLDFNDCYDVKVDEVITD